MLLIYRGLTNLLFPILIIVMFFRTIIKKEDKFRYKEKLYSSHFKPKRNLKKKLIWFHAASIGEVKSIIPLIEKFDNDKYEFLITSVTLSSSKLISSSLSTKRNISHRFFPFDKLNLVKHFLNVWSPDLAIFVDSEIWPNFLIEAKEKKIPLILINGRITKKTFKRWMLISNFAKKIFNTFDLCLASSNESKIHLQQLNAKNISFVGNIKLASPVDSNNAQNKNAEILDQKKVWCAASTHDGEDIIFLKTHLNLKKSYNNNLITIIIPRHISRCKDIQILCRKNNLKSQILNNNEMIETKNEIVIVNSFGVLNEYFKYCKSVFIGKSLLKRLELVGGQNPIEAAKLGCKIYHGPYISNFKEIYSLLKSYKISYLVNDENDLSKKIKDDLDSNEIDSNKSTNNINLLGQKILFDSMKEINKIL